MPYEKAPSSGAFSPLSLMYFLSGEPMHDLSGVDTVERNRRNWPPPQSLSGFLTQAVEETTLQHQIAPIPVMERSLFNHLVSADEQRWRHGQAEYLGGSEIYDELKLCRLFDRQISRICTLENAIDKISCTPVQVDEASTVRYQSAGFGR